MILDPFISGPSIDKIPQPMRDAALVDAALMAWRGLLFDQRRITFKQRMEMAHGHRRFLESYRG